MSFIMASHAAKWSGGRLCGPDIRLCRSWKNDSRETAPGDAFVALKGENTDGHLYVHKAIERGAKLLLVDSCFVGELELESHDYSGITVIAVPDTAEEIGRAHV